MTGFDSGATGLVFLDFWTDVVAFGDADVMVDVAVEVAMCGVVVATASAIGVVVATSGTGWVIAGASARETAMNTAPITIRRITTRAKRVRRSFIFRLYGIRCRRSMRSGELYLGFVRMKVIV